MFRDVLRAAPAALVVFGLAGCSREVPDRFSVNKPGVSASYSKETGKLKRLDADTNKNGKIDTFSTWDGTKLVRIEIDKDEDGKIDRWEHYKDDNTKVESVGTSSRGDGVEDTISWPPDASGVVKTEIDLDRDGHVDRREFMRPAPDGRLYMSEIETEFDTAGRPGLRTLYGPGAVFLKIEKLR